MAVVAPDPLVDQIAQRIPAPAAAVPPQPAQLAAVTAQIVRGFRPNRVVLFGSRAGTSATNDSDIDLMIVMETTGRSVDQAVAIRQSLDLQPPFPLDILVRRPDQIERAFLDGDAFITEILTSGITLYEANDR